MCRDAGSPLLWNPADPPQESGPEFTPADLLFGPLWPLIVPTSDWRRSAPEKRETKIPASLQEPLKIWVMSCFPDEGLVDRLIAAGDGSSLPVRDPLEEPEWAAPVQRGAELLWSRTAEVLSRPVPDLVLEEMAESSGLKISELQAILVPLGVIFSESSLLFPRGSNPVPGVMDRQDLSAALHRIAQNGVVAWSYAMPLLFAARNEIDVVLPAARAVALAAGEGGRYLRICEDALAAIFPLFEARCQTALQDIEKQTVQPRTARRTRLWLDVPELATILSLVRFSARCCVHVLPAAELRLTAGRACREQFRFLVKEDQKVLWPRSPWPDSLATAFECGNRRLRNLAFIGSILSRPEEFRPELQKLVTFYQAYPDLGLSLVERMRTCEILSVIPGVSPLLDDYLSMLPAPSAAMQRGSAKRRKSVNYGVQPWHTVG